MSKVSQPNICVQIAFDSKESKLILLQKRKMCGLLLFLYNLFDHVSLGNVCKLFLLNIKRIILKTCFQNRNWRDILYIKKFIQSSHIASYLYGYFTF